MALNSFIPSLWAAATLEAFRPAEVVAPLTNREYEGEAVRGNKVTVNSLTIGDGTPVQDYAAGTLPDPADETGAATLPRTHNIDNVNSSSQDVVIDQEKVIAFQVGDIDRVQAAGSFESVTRDAAKLLSEDAESFIVSTMKTGGTAAGTTAITTGDAAVDKVGELRKLMTKANVPSSGRFLVVNPEFLELLLKADSKLSSVDTSGSPEGLRDAMVGRLSAFNIVESNMLTNSDKPAAIALHTSAVAYVNQIQEVEGFRSHTSFADVVRMLHVYGAKVLRPTAVQVYLSA